MNIGQEYSSLQPHPTEECYKVTKRVQILKGIADEVFRRYEQGDRQAFEILKKAYSSTGGGVE